jgi:hypothetical protein
MGDKSKLLRLLNMKKEEDPKPAQSDFKANPIWEDNTNFRTAVIGLLYEISYDIDRISYAQEVIAGIKGDKSNKGDTNNGS